MYSIPSISFDVISEQSGMMRGIKGTLLQCIIVTFVFGAFSNSNLHAQTKFKDKFNMNGYVKDMHILNIFDKDSTIQDNFIHNRLNFRYYANKKITAGLEFRNRFFYGEALEANPIYKDIIGYDLGLVDLSFNLYSSKSFLLNSTIDRGWVDYMDDNWNIRIGRQRINWGINLAWNPNDIFNAYDFTDFDYEERPGSDAIKIQRFLKGMNNIEAVYKFTGNYDTDIYALKYGFNKWTYDFQLFAAKAEKDAAAGLGWAGSLKNVGFKGEATYFHPYDHLDSAAGVLGTALSFDYTFRKGIYINFGTLFNSAGLDSPDAIAQSEIFAQGISAKNLSPSQFSYIGQVSGNFTPLLGWSGTVMYLQGVNILFLMPSLSYSVSNSWDINLLGQIYAGEQNQVFKNLGSSVFLRLKWSF